MIGSIIKSVVGGIFGGIAGLVKDWWNKRKMAKLEQKNIDLQKEVFKKDQERQKVEDDHEIEKAVDKVDDAQTDQEFLDAWKKEDKK